MKIFIVNEHGMRQIAAHLENHQKHWSPECVSMLQVYAREAEMHASEGNGFYFEIAARHSNSGNPVICMITEDGIEQVECAQ